MAELFAIAVAVLLAGAPAALAPESPADAPTAADTAARVQALWQALDGTGGQPGDWLLDTAVQLPVLRQVHADDAEHAWSAIKQLASPAEQAQAIRQSGVQAMACDDLIDFRAAAQRSGANFEFRDDVRGRSWARPALVRLLLRAQEAFAAEYPDVPLMVGDIAQAGCGQIEYGTLVRQLSGNDGGPLLRDVAAAARRVLGEPVVTEWKTAADFAAERDRFDGPAAKVLVETKVLGAAVPLPDAAPTALRVAVRRFAEVLPGKKPKKAKARLSKLLAEVKKLMDRGELVRHQALKTFDPATGKEQTAWLQHRVDRKKGRQLQWIGVGAAVGAGDLSTLAEVRISSWKPGKPESFSGETRLRPVRGEAGQIVGWSQYKMLGEAGHVSHTSGRDADIAFVFTDNRGMARPSLKKLNVKATLRWMQILHETAASLGTPLDSVFVSKAVRQWLGRKMPSDFKQSELWQKVVQVAPGHDAHHHVRLVPPAPADDAAALADLSREPVQAAGGGH